MTRGGGDERARSRFWARRATEPLHRAETTAFRTRRDPDDASRVPNPQLLLLLLRHRTTIVPGRTRHIIITVIAFFFFGTTACVCVGCVLRCTVPGAGRRRTFSRVTLPTRLGRRDRYHRNSCGRKTKKSRAQFPLVRDRYCEYCVVWQPWVCSGGNNTPLHNLVLLNEFFRYDLQNLFFFFLLRKILVIGKPILLDSREEFERK